MTRNISTIAIKLFGIYALFRLISYTPIAFSIPLMLRVCRTSDLLTAISILLGYALIHLTVAFLFIFKTNFILKLFKFPEEEEQENIDVKIKPFALSLGLMLIGIYFFISYCGCITKSLLLLFRENSYTTDTSGWWIKYISEIVVMLGSLFLIFKNKAIADFLIRRTNKAPQKDD
jgi:hypothetical protein